MSNAWFLKSECKSTNYFSFHQIFSQKSCFFSRFFNIYKDFTQEILAAYIIIYMRLPVHTLRHIRKRKYNKVAELSQVV